MSGRLRNRLRAIRSLVILGRALLVAQPVRPKTLAQRLVAIPTQDLPLEHPVTIRWNDHHVPWIDARTDRDCAVALGVVHAHLRLGQMEVMRRIAYGRTAEMLGPAAIDADRLLRTLNLPQAVPAILAMMPDATRQWLDGFVDGINHVIANVKELPPDFDFLALGREPWTAADVMAVGRTVSADVNWLVWFRLMHLRGAPEWSGLWEKVLRAGEAGTLAGDAPDSMLATMLGPSRHGSNAWAVSAEASATGGALLACDPHLGIVLPNLWLLAAYRCPSYHATGLMIPALPFVAVGRNPWIAWGGTALHAASSDLFDLSTLPDEPIETRTETIRVRGGKPVNVTIRTSRYGPLVSDAVRMEGTLALRWVGHEPSDELSAMLGMNAARSFDAFRDAAERLAVPGQTFIVAEASGGIAKQIAVKLPCRPHVLPDYPLVHPSGIEHWQRFATTRDFAPERDPPRGFVVSANDRPPGPPVPVGFLFSPADRRERITEILAASRPISRKLMRDLQCDVTLPSALVCRDRLVALIEALPQRRARQTAQILALLRDWDGSYAEDSRGALTFELLMANLCARHYGKMERAFHAVLWSTRELIASDIATLGTEVFAALASALEQTENALKRYRTWGDIHHVVLAHPLGRLPIVGRRLVFADFPVAGTTDTVMKTAGPSVPRRHNAFYGSVARVIADLSGMDETYAVLLGGQDGWLGSDTLLDQRGLWRSRDTIRLPLDPPTALREFPHVTPLKPRDTS